VDVEGDAGEAELLRRSGGDLPATWEFTSGKGRGLLYAIPAGATLRTTSKWLEIGQELRLQAKGTQTVLPPSRHPNGRLYHWRAGHGPGEIEAATMPKWMIERMHPDRPERHVINLSAWRQQRNRIASDCHARARTERFRRTG
jgi:hypothetical protein